MAKKTFSIGDQVEHKVFGKGTIVDIERVSETNIFDDTKITIKFSDNATKKILAKFVKEL